MGKNSMDMSGKKWINPSNLLVCGYYWVYNPVRNYAYIADVRQNMDDEFLVDPDGSSILAISLPEGTQFFGPIPEPDRPTT